jgi:hypothetical protein
MLRDLALRRGWGLIDDDLSEHRLAAWTREQDARIEEASAALQPGEAKGFAARTTRDVFERAKAFRDSLPHGLGAALDDRLAGYKRTRFNKAAAAEDRARLRAVRENLNATLETTVIPAAMAAGTLPAGDPDKLDRLADAEGWAEKLIDRNPALSPQGRRVAASNRRLGSGQSERTS